MTLNATAPVNPFAGVTVAVYVVPPPGRTVLDDGVAVNEKSVTVTVRVAGWLVAPLLSVTVNDAVYVPAVEYVMLPGAAAELEAGLPPGNVQEYEAMVPSGSLPVPAKETACPAMIVTFPPGLVIVAVGGRFGMDADTCTNCARDGTPPEFRMNSM